MRKGICDLLRDERTICVVLFAVLAVVKSPQLFIDPRFWAEEGKFYFAAFQSMSMWNALRFCYLGSHQGATNLIVYTATSVPIRYAPTVTTDLSFAAHALVAWQVGMVVGAHSLPRTAGILLIICWPFLPQTYEVWLTASNLQWLAGVSVLLIFCLPDRPLQRHPMIFAIWALAPRCFGYPALLASISSHALDFDIRYWSRASRRNVCTIGFPLHECDARRSAISRRSHYFARTHPLAKHHWTAI
jgi:hypothetical protein